MPVELKGNLKNLVKKQKFVIVAIDDESYVDSNTGEEVPMLKVEIEDELSARGSNPLPNGQPMLHKDNFIYIAGADDVAAFQKDVDDTTNTYEGPMKLDVAKPKAIVRNGKAEIVKAPRIWLTITPFAKRGSSMRNDNRTLTNNAILGLFGQSVSAGTGGGTGAGGNVNANAEGVADNTLGG